MTPEQKHLVRSYAQRVAAPNGVAIIDVPIRYRDAVIDCLSDIPDERWRLDETPADTDRGAARALAAQFATIDDAWGALKGRGLDSAFVLTVLEECRSEGDQ